MIFAASITSGANTSITAESKSSKTSLLSGRLSLEAVSSKSAAAIGDFSHFGFSANNIAAGRDTCPAHDKL